MRHVEHTTPYPWPWHGVLDPSDLALVAVGWDQRTKAGTDQPDAALRNIERLADAVALTVTVGHDPAQRRGGGPGTQTALSSLGCGTVQLVAAGSDAFYGSPLDPVLRHQGVGTILVAGLGLETTVHSTLRSANDRGYECLLVVDACAPVDPDLVSAAVSMIEMSGGIFGAVGTTDNVLAALLRSQPTHTEVNS